MDEKQARQAESLDRLSKSALERFKARLDWEWKARLGLWTALGAATAFAFASETWRPSDADFLLVLVAMIVLVVVYGLCFALSVHLLHAEDIRLWRAYETQITKLVWGADNVPVEASPGPRRWIWAGLLSWGQFLVTLLFAVSLVFAVHARTNRTAANQSSKSEIAIKQDVPSKVTVEPK